MNSKLFRMEIIAASYAKTTVRAWYDRKNKPRLDAILIICYGLKQQVKEILDGFGDAGYLPAVGCEPMFKPKHSIQRRPFDHDLTETVLKEIITAKQSHLFQSGR